LDDKIKGDEMDGTYTPHRGDENCIKILVGIPQGKRPLGRSSSGCEDIKINANETGCKCVDWI
jgi:hypothetical protein